MKNHILLCGNFIDDRKLGHRLGHTILFIVKLLEQNYNNIGEEKMCAKIRSFVCYKQYSFMVLFIYEHKHVSLNRSI